MSHKRVTQLLLAILLLALMTGIVNAQNEPLQPINLVESADPYSYWMEPVFEHGKFIKDAPATYIENAFDGKSATITNNPDANHNGFYIASGIGFKLNTSLLGYRYGCIQVKLDEMIWGNNTDLQPDFRITLANKDTGETWGVRFTTPLDAKKNIYGGCVDFLLLQGTYSTQGNVLTDLSGITAIGVDSYSIIGREIKYDVVLAEVLPEGAELPTVPQGGISGGFSPDFRCALYSEIPQGSWSAPLLKKYRQECSAVVAEGYIKASNELKSDPSWKTADGITACEAFGSVPPSAINMFDLVTMNNQRCGDPTQVVHGLTPDYIIVKILDGLASFGMDADEMSAFFAVWAANGTVIPANAAIQCIDLIDSDLSGNEFYVAFTETVNCDAISYFAPYVAYDKGVSVNVALMIKDGIFVAKDDREDFQTFWARTAADRSELNLNAPG